MVAATDDFNRANESLFASPNWNMIRWFNYETMLIVSNEVEAIENIAGLWATPADTTDQYAQIDWTNPTSGEIHGPVICNSGAWGATSAELPGYHLDCYQWETGVVRLFRNNTEVDFHDGDDWGALETLRIEKNGADIEGFRNGVSVVTYTDPSPLTGLRFGFSSRTPNVGNPRFDNFAGGDLAGGAAVRRHPRRRIYQLTR